MHGNVSISECARLLSLSGDQIDRSALSRYCDTHSLKLASSGKSVLVNYEAVQEHRKINYRREVMSGTPLGDAAPAVAATPSNVHTLPTRDDPQRELKMIELNRKRREDALDEGLLAPVAEMDAGAADAIVEMRAAFAAARADMAERLAAELGLPPEKLRHLRTGLKRYDRVGQDAFARAMSRALAEANEQPGPAFARLNTLAALALRLRFGGETSSRDHGAT